MAENDWYHISSGGRIRFGMDEMNFQSFHVSQIVVETFLCGVRGK